MSVAGAPVERIERSVAWLSITLLLRRWGAGDIRAWTRIA
jgi:hypothetical protein